MTTPVLLDCDPGHDDAIALLLALASPEVELVGVTTVAGNQTLAKTTANALRVLDLVEASVPVAAGADRPSFGSIMGTTASTARAAWMVPSLLHRGAGRATATRPTSSPSRFPHTRAA